MLSAYCAAWAIGTEVRRPKSPIPCKAKGQRQGRSSRVAKYAGKRGGNEGKYPKDPLKLRCMHRWLRKRNAAFGYDAWPSWRLHRACRRHVHEKEASRSQQRQGPGITKYSRQRAECLLR